MEATDGEIGHVEGFVIDNEAWAIRYIEVATRNWLPGKKVLVSPAWIERVSWPESKVYVRPFAGSHQGLPRSTCYPGRSLANMRTGSTLTTAARHIGLHEAEHQTSFSLSGV